MCSYVVLIDENPRGVYRDAGRASPILGYIPSFVTGCSHSRGTRRWMEGRHLTRINNSVRRARVQRLLLLCFASLSRRYDLRRRCLL